MDDNKPNLDHQWTKEIRNKFNLFIKENNNLLGMQSISKEIMS